MLYGCPLYVIVAHLAADIKCLLVSVSRKESTLSDNSVFVIVDVFVLLGFWTPNTRTIIKSITCKYLVPFECMKELLCDTRGS